MRQIVLRSTNKVHWLRLRSDVGPPALRESPQVSNFERPFVAQNHKQLLSRDIERTANEPIICASFCPVFARVISEEQVVTIPDGEKPSEVAPGGKIVRCAKNTGEAIARQPTRGVGHAKAVAR